MPVSTYAASAATYLRLLAQLDVMLDKAAAHAEAKKIKPPVLLGARLFPDMWGLAEQVRAVANHATRGIARLTAVSPPSFDGKDETFADLKARTAWAADFVRQADRAAIDAGAERSVTFPSGDKEKTLVGEHYLLAFSLPNFYFHLTSVYAILRHNGVPLVKDDFVGPI